MNNDVQQKTPPTASPYLLNNGSGLGRESLIPPEIRKWSWGAFFLNWVWGIGNSVWIALLMFIPPLTFIMPFILGAKGNEWAWRKQYWHSVEAFKRTQRLWAWWGLAIFLSFIGMIAFWSSDSDFQKARWSAFQNNDVIKEVLGEPIEKGSRWNGFLKKSWKNGKSCLYQDSFVSGPKGSGHYHLGAVNVTGDWDVLFERLILEDGTTFKLLEKDATSIERQVLNDCAPTF